MNSNLQSVGIKWILGTSIASAAILKNCQEESEGLAKRAVEEQTERIRYETRCVFERDGVGYNLNTSCDQLGEELTRKLNVYLGKAQGWGAVKAVESFAFCPDFHWGDGEVHDSKNMLAAPGPHSHFTFEDNECVAGLYVYTHDDGELFCAIHTMCNDKQEGLDRLDVYVQGGCDLENFDVGLSLNSLDLRIERAKK
ncbi:MAG: hypothetical protein AAB383_05480 [Patescibacteria group bacterium]